AISYWALPEDELLSSPGYRQGSAEREEDIKKARQLFDAAGSPELPQVWFADIPSYIPNFIGTWKQFMNKNLGISVDKLRTLSQAYSRIAEALADDSCDLASMYWGFDNGWIDLDDWVYPYFHSTGSKNSFRLKDPDLDKLLDAQRREFDIEKRRQLGYQIQRYLLGLEGDGMQKGAQASVDRSGAADYRTTLADRPDEVRLQFDCRKAGSLGKVRAHPAGAQPVCKSNDDGRPEVAGSGHQLVLHVEPAGHEVRVAGEHLY